MISFQHDGTGIIKYSFLGSTLPGYVDLIDLDVDGTNDVADVFNTGYGGDFLGVNLLSNGDVPNLGFTVAQQAGLISAIGAWNEVANIRLEPGSSDRFSGSSTGTEVTGTGSLVTGLGGDADFGETTLARNDDGSSSVDISPVFSEGVNFFGTDYSNIFVNTNGSISFSNGISTFTPSTITGGSTPIIAPFWADVDTRTDSDPDTPDSAPIYVDLDTGRGIVTITWANVGYFSRNADKTNSFQLQLYDRGSGDFDIVFRYDSINWTTGDASDGEGGLGGTPARMGYSAGNQTDFFELPAAGRESAVLGLDSQRGNTDQPGLWEFEVRNGGVFGDVVFGQADLLLEGSYDLASIGLDDFPYSAAGNSGVSSSDPEVFGPDGDVYFMTPDGAEGFSFFPGEQDYAAALRAVGLALGFERPFESGFSVLEPDESAPFAITPGNLDITLAQSIYGPNWGTRADDTVYFAPDGIYEVDEVGRLPESGALGLATIWDAGGNDLLDLSHNTSGTRTDMGGLIYALQPSGGITAFADVADPVYLVTAQQELGLPPDNHIEAARMGSGQDTVFGTEWAEEIEGGLGDDGMNGLAGDDVLHGGYGLANRPDREGSDGNDTLVGGEGTDTAVFDNPNTYTLVLSPERIVMTDRNPNGTGNDELHTIEKIAFEEDRFDVFPDDIFDLEIFDGILEGTPQQIQEITELYIAYFNRAPDAIGLLFWADAYAQRGETIESIAARFIDQDETRALYPEGTGNSSFIGSVYQNVLGRDVDQGGLDFWLPLMESGAVRRDTFILDILRGAKADPPPDATQDFIDLQSADQSFLATKTDIGSYFALSKGMSNVSNANEVMQLFTRETMDAQAAINAANSFAETALDDTFGEFLVQVQGVIDNPFDI